MNQNLQRNSYRQLGTGAIFGALFTCMAASLVAMHKPDPPSEVIAQRFVLQNAQGEAVAELGGGDDGVSFKFLQKNETRLRLAMSPDGQVTEFGIYHPKNRPAITMGTMPGPQGNAALFMHDEKGNPMLQASISGGDPQILFLDEGFRVDVGVGVNKKKPNIKIFDDNGESVWSAIVSQE